MRQALRQDRPGNISDRGVALFAGAEVTGINRFLQFLQGLSSGTNLKLGSGRSGSSAVGGCDAVHGTKSLWISEGIIAQDTGDPVSSAVFRE